MSGLTHVCLSDLHLGADYSVLTRMAGDGGTTLLQPGDVLVAFGIALRQYVAALAGPEPPTLILLGDVLDLGLSPVPDVAQGFRRFVEALFPAGAPPVFSHRIVYVPGNHDHHVWRTAQDRWLLDALRADPAVFDVPDEIDQTALFAPEPIVGELMTGLMRGYPHLADAVVHVAYPNLGLCDERRARTVVLHHGHYVDATYRLMSAIHGRLAGGSGRPLTVAQLERENGAWVDFLWSDLGSSGVIAGDATTLYEAMRNAAAAYRLAERLGAALTAQLARAVGIGGGVEVTPGVTVASAVQALIDATLVRAAESERDDYWRVLSADSIADLRWYVGGPVRQQIAEAGKLHASRDLTFVFGHTHKPFQDQLVVPGFAEPVGIYNTGGWVMDQPTMAAAQGAAAIFVDGALNVASLRLFNDPLNGDLAPVHAAGVGSFRDADNLLLARMREALGPTAGAWRAFSDAAGTALELHAKTLLEAT